MYPALIAVLVSAKNGDHFLFSPQSTYLGYPTDNKRRV
jgi:hypothetical protein